ncbi:hypothetical protein BVI434_2050004 [Burkholderia vietnamiensis]|nr:hypothetical protein BVI434_2050004 [Burkholderia vietnamiensis]
MSGSRYASRCVQRHAALPHPLDRDPCAASIKSVEYDRESRQPIDTPDPKSVGGRAASGRVDPAC